MKIEFKNGSVIETIDSTGVKGVTRGKRSKLIFYQDMNLKWYQRLYLKILPKTNGLFSGLWRR